MPILPAMKAWRAWLEGRLGIFALAKLSKVASAVIPGGWSKATFFSSGDIMRPPLLKTRLWNIQFPVMSH